MIVFIVGVLSLACTIAYTNYDDAKTYRGLLEISRQETRYLEEEVFTLREENDKLKAKVNQGKVTISIDTQEVTEKVLKKVNEEIKRIKAENKFL